MKQELLKGGTDSLFLNLMDHGRPVTPASCSCRILEGSTVLESGTATSGVYTPGSATVSQARQDITVEWTWVEISGGKTEKRTELVDVVLFKLYPVVTGQDLVRADAALSSEDYVYHGEVETLEAPGFTDRNLIGALEDWLGAVVTFLTGTDAGGQYIVTAFDATSGEVTLNSASTTTPTAGDKYSMRRSFQGEIDAAWDDVYDRLVQACAASSRDRPALIMTPDRLRRPHLARALEKVFRGLADDPNGMAWAKAEHYAKEFDAVWNGLSLAFADPEAEAPVKARDGSASWGFSR